MAGKKKVVENNIETTDKVVAEKDSNLEKQNAMLMDMLKQMQEKLAELENKSIQETKVDEPKKVVEVIHETMKLDKLIPVKSLVEGTLNWSNPQSGFECAWSYCGEVLDIPYDEIRIMKNINPKFLYKPWIEVMNDVLIKQYKLEEVYAKFKDITNYEDLIMQSSVSELKEKLSKLPIDAKQNVAIKAKQLIKEERLGDLFKIEAIEKESGMDLLLSNKKK